MPLFDPDVIQEERNIDLTSPEGQTIATALIAAVNAWVFSFVGHDIESSTRNAYFEDGERKMFFPSSDPVSAVGVSIFNTVTTNYNAVAGSYVRFSDHGVVDVSVGLPCGFQAVKLTFISVSY